MLQIRAEPSAAETWMFQFDDVLTSNRGNWSKRRQTKNKQPKTSTTITPTKQNGDKSKCQPTETSTDQNTDEQKRQQTKTATDPSYKL